MGGRCASLGNRTAAAGGTRVDGTCWQMVWRAGPSDSSPLLLLLLLL
jgi:hypothetical protein